MTDWDPITIYRMELTRTYEEIGSAIPDTTPLGVVSAEIREMITSYLTDAASFHACNDNVNEYASLSYAHGWIDAAIYLGLLTGRTIPLFLPLDCQIPGSQHERLIEKTCRYERMLNEAVLSVQTAPERGSPLFQAALFIEKKAEDTCTRVRAMNSGDGYTASLGELSYGYGWLDTGVRAGLFRISGNPHLFTTDTDNS